MSYKITDLCFAWYGCDPAHLSTLERVDDTALPYIWVADKPNRNLLLI